MKLYKLNRSEKKGIIERFYYRKYAGSSHFGITLMNIVDKNVELTLKNKKAVAMGYNLKDLLIEQISFEKNKNLCYYDKYKYKLN